MRETQNQSLQLYGDIDSYWVEIDIDKEIDISINQDGSQDNFCIDIGYGISVESGYGKSVIRIIDYPKSIESLSHILDKRLLFKIHDYLCNPNVSNTFVMYDYEYERFKESITTYIDNFNLL